MQPPGRFGAISLSGEQTKIESFHEKPTGDGAWINGGYFVVDPAAIDYIDNDGTNELLVGGEFMPISIFKNVSSKWINITTKTKLMSDKYAN